MIINGKQLMTQLFNLRGLTFSGQLKSTDYNCTFFYASIYIYIYIYIYMYMYILKVHSFKIEIQLIYNIMFQVYSKVIQFCIYVCIFFFRFFSTVSYYKILSRVPCARYIFVNPRLLIYTPSQPFTLKLKIDHYFIDYGERH